MPSLDPPKKSSQGDNLIRTLETPPGYAQSDYGTQDLTSASGTPRRGFQGPDQVDPMRLFVVEAKISNLVLV